MALNESEIRRPASVVLLFREGRSGEQVLLVKHDERAPRKQGTYGFPGGRSDEGDKTPKHTAARELEEETGLRVSPGNLVALRDGENIFSGTHIRDGRPQRYSIRVYEVKDPNAVEGHLRRGKYRETIPVWATVRTLSRRRRVLMESVEPVLHERQKRIKG